MLKIYSDTKIYVHCPAGVVTGGAELIHQLVDVLRRNKLQAFVIYFGNLPHIVPSEYKDYNIELSDSIVDTPHNIEVIYEGVFNFIQYSKQIQKLLWWLSVDNFFICSTAYLSLCDLAKWNLKLAIRSLLHRYFNLFFKGENYFCNTLSFKQLRDMNVMHGYQSEYAQNFLQNKGFGELVELKDYINTDHIAPFSTENRQNIVLYNPKKGMNFTRKLITLTPELKWIPIQNMQRKQLADLMRKSKLYIDFGYHPGKDRLPRECAMNGCCIISGKRGSARFFEDVPIGNKYKFDEKRDSKSNIIDMIHYILDNYETAINDFAFYRNRILLEKKEFEAQVKNIFLL